MAEIASGSTTSRAESSRKGRTDLMSESPMQFIKYEGGKLELIEETTTYLSGFNLPICVIGIAGVAGSGKSYLMNRLNKNGAHKFEVGGEGTKGIWVRTLLSKGKQGEDFITLLLDTEGLGSQEDDNIPDATLFALAVFFSSFFVYNTFGDIDERAILQLHFVLSLPNVISTTDDFKKQPPPFMWVLRDNSKQVDKAYLEIHLDIKEGIEINSQTCNFITRRFTSYFRERDCFSLPSPTSPENTKNLQDMNDEILDSTFVGKIEELASYIYQRAPLKTVFGADSEGERKLFKLTCANFVKYAREYVTRVNDSAPMRKKETPRRGPSRKDLRTPRTARGNNNNSNKDAITKSKSFGPVDVQLQINTSKYEQELLEDEKRKAPLTKRGEESVITITEPKEERQTECTNGAFSGLLLTCVGYARYTLGALVIFALVIGLIIYFTRR